MKFALIFLTALVAITQQQFQQQRMGRPWWLPSYYSPQPAVASYQHIYYNNFPENTPSFRQVKPSRPYVTNSAQLNPSYMDVDYSNDFTEDIVDDEYPITESRNRVPEVRYRPALPNRVAIPNPRFFINYYTNVASLLTKTATFTVTSSLSLTSIQSCIAAAKFLDDAAKSKACRRKREIIDNAPHSEDLQFAIIPSQTQQVTPTAVPSLDGETGHLPPYQVDSFNDNVGELSGSISAAQNLRERRFLKYSVTSTTVTTFSILSTTVTKTVALAGDGEVECLPSGYVVC
ncbi:uncharacterized protein LOC130690329 isoform X2 [Daphnia carinata]|uniref:uncharacterized protein LOC130690329 isoform X2 n=1 Tax=Daphnia carinata TaxID=120202 RepID=UPI00257D6A5A|nr:uncharacterized protein LOC130690329 isoform X2 [Daphnia carinata]